MSDVEIWGVVLQEGHWNHGGWTVDSRDGLLVCACGEVIPDAPKRGAASTELVGPLQPVRYSSGPVRWHDLPRNTLDIRYAACVGHHLACDCREALMAEDAGEFLAMWNEVRQAILAAIKGHQTYAFTGTDDIGWSGEDEFAQCKCQACAIARSAGIGFSECMQQHRADRERLAAESRERQRAYYAAHFSYTDEVPF